MRERIVRPLAAGALCVCALIVGAKADCIGGAETTTAVNLRTGAGTGNAIIATVGEGTALIVEADTGSGWYKVNYDGEIGYMSADYLSFSETMDLTAQGWVDGSDVRMRAAAGTDSEIVRVTTYGESVEILGVDGEWYKVSAGGKTGYIRGDYVSFTEPDPSQAPAAGSIGEQIVAFAEQFLGTPYVWAGSSPSGFDCSGFVSYVFKNFGYTVNRTAASMYTNGVAVDKSELQIGDAVFFASSSESIGHVGIYIGDGEFIHSSSGCGYVTISGLDESYYSRMYVGARRIAS
ncbi:MAG: SH3 domain-containing C40 family peptidase [Oscillospiraceae bacterium]|nr:SH3 domain-containing C40 family peptidase [Oscillospiraceae bacterium]